MSCPPPSLLILHVHFFREGKFSTNLLAVAPIESDKYLTLGRFDSRTIFEGLAPPQSICSKGFDISTKMGANLFPAYTSLF